MGQGWKNGLLQWYVDDICVNPLYGDFTFALKYVKWYCCEMLWRFICISLFTNDFFSFNMQRISDMAFHNENSNLLAR
jgi:hypothetical protein